MSGWTGALALNQQETRSELAAQGVLKSGMAATFCAECLFAQWCRTWNNIVQHTHGFLGFCHTHCMEEGERLGLWVFRDKFVTGFLRYISFLKARGRGGDYLSKNCHTALRHLHFLRASSPVPYTALENQQFKEQLDMLNTLKWQLRKISHHVPFDYKALMDGAQWKDAPEIIAFIEQQKEQACTAFKVSWHWALPGCRCAGSGCRQCARGALDVHGRAAWQHWSVAKCCNA